MKFIEGGVTAADGYVAAGCHCGIKSDSDVKDLALVFSERPATVAGVFTRNRMASACVTVSKKVVEKGSARAIVINSGCANTCTGAEGQRNAEEMARTAADKLDISPEEVVVASTGVIGAQLPVVKVCEGIEKLASELSREGGSDAAVGILTTDTRAKEVAVRLDLSTGPVTIGGMAKGAGMIMPNMATMLAFVTTDAAVDKESLQSALGDAVNRSFNRISIDGDSSTNDMVVVLANGDSANPLRGKDVEAFEVGLALVCLKLALMIVEDGEGATKLVEIRVTGARDDVDAERAARTIGTSLLFKTALFGEDPNWGRIMMAIGMSGAAVEPDRVAVLLDDLQLVSGGVGTGYSEEDARALLAKKEISITVDLGMGPGETRFWTTDLSYDYIKINAEYHT
jgi:glutamate N-acetyltransferase/amino-acid N-acetyltransferase